MVLFKVTIKDTVIFEEIEWNFAVKAKWRSFSEESKNFIERFIGSRENLIYDVADKEIHCDRGSWKEKGRYLCEIIAYDIMAENDDADGFGHITSKMTKIMDGDFSDFSITE